MQQTKKNEEDIVDWQQLAKVIRKQSSSSDDTEPFRTAHFEMRYYHVLTTKKEAVKKPKPKVERSVWNELAKYNYTQAPPNKGEEELESTKGKEKEKEKEKEEPEEEKIQGEENELPVLDASDLPDEKTSALIESFLRALGKPFSSLVTKSTGPHSRFLVKTDHEVAKNRLAKLLHEGITTEPGVFQTREQAEEFVTKLVTLFEKHSVVSWFSNKTTTGSGARLWLRGSTDEGFFIVTKDKLLMIWFLGY